MLDAEFTVTEGKYERRKVWKYFSLHGDAAPNHTLATPAPWKARSTSTPKT
jgi:hypothetical protein